MTGSIDSIEETSDGFTVTASFTTDSQTAAWGVGVDLTHPNHQSEGLLVHRKAEESGQYSFTFSKSKIIELVNYHADWLSPETIGRTSLEFEIREREYDDYNYHASESVPLPPSWFYNSYLFIDDHDPSGDAPSRVYVNGVRIPVGDVDVHVRKEGPLDVTRYCEGEFASPHNGTEYSRAFKTLTPSEQDSPDTLRVDVRDRVSGEYHTAFIGVRLSPKASDQPSTGSD